MLFKLFFNHVPLSLISKFILVHMFRESYFPSKVTILYMGRTYKYEIHLVQSKMK